MNAKEYLSRARLMDMQVRSRQEQILILRSMAERVSAGFGREAVSRSLNTTAMQDTVARILEAEAELAGRIDELVRTRMEIAGVIDRVEDVRVRLILEKRYLCFRDWREITEEMNYSLRYVQEKHREGLRAVQRILEETENAPRQSASGPAPI